MAKLRYDYKVYKDNSGRVNLFVRDYGDTYAPSVEKSELYYFSCDEGRAEAAKYLAEIMSDPNEVYLSEWHISDFDTTGSDAQALLKELKSAEAEGNGGAWLIMEGDIYT